VTLRVVSHVTQIVGVVVDSKRTFVKGALIELLAKGPVFNLLDARRTNGNPVPWRVRQEWAKQVVRGVAAFHERGQVLGYLRTYNWSVCTNKYNDAVVAGMHGSHTVVHGQDGLLPPEYRTEAFEKGDGQVKPEFDVFQLGSLLWHLYRNQYQQGVKTFCSLAGCNKVKATTCNLHKDPIALPKAASDIPEYLD
jgi:hypothetical protein